MEICGLPFGTAGTKWNWVIYSAYFDACLRPFKHNILTKYKGEFKKQNNKNIITWGFYDPQMRMLCQGAGKEGRNGEEH